MNDSLVHYTDTVRDTVIEEVPVQSSTPTTATSNGSSSWVDWAVIGLFICIVYIVWKFSQEISSISNKLEENKKIVSEQNKKIKDIEDKINVKNLLSTGQTTVLPTPSTQKEVSKSHEVDLNLNQKTVSETKKKKQTDKPKTIVTNTEIKKYGTLQAPDQNGVLRFAERTMLDTSSPEKWFLLEIDETSGSGTYRINPEAKSRILGDLQTFQVFVKPFTFNGISGGSTIQDKVPGKISKKGNFWIVDEPLEISIN